MTRTPQFRTGLKDIPAYRAGKRAEGRAGDVYSLASNETAFGPLPGVMAAAHRAAADTHRYTDPWVTALRSRLAEHLDVQPDWIATGTGSVALCQQAVVATCDAGDEVIFAWRSFEAYPIITRLAHAVARQIPLTADGHHDLEAMKAAITERTRLIFLCTPNNPTGPPISPEALHAFVAEVPDRVLIVLDEAYYEFAQHTPDVADGVELVRNHHNVLVLRTFSKAYGLAGLRIGYGVAQPSVTTAMAKTALPFGVSASAQAAAIASLDAHDAMAERVAEVVRERDRVVGAARATGWAVPETAANFYWLPLGGQALDFADDCLAVGVTVRAFPDEGVRVTVGEAEANNRVLDVLASKYNRQA